MLLRRSKTMYLSPWCVLLSVLWTKCIMTCEVNSLLCIERTNTFLWTKCGILWSVEDHGQWAVVTTVFSNSDAGVIRLNSHMRLDCFSSFFVKLRISLKSLLFSTCWLFYCMTSATDNFPCVIIGAKSEFRTLAVFFWNAFVSRYY